jgi:hypothetical protein
MSEQYNLVVRHFDLSGRLTRVPITAFMPQGTPPYIQTKKLDRLRCFLCPFCGGNDFEDGIDINDYECISCGNSVSVINE